MKREFDLYLRSDGTYDIIAMIRDGVIDPDQSWFWTPEWQTKEREADADLAAGRYEDFDNIDDFVNSL